MSTDCRENLVRSTLGEMGLSYDSFVRERKADYTTQDGSQGKQALLDELRDEIGDCKRCVLSSKRTKMVFGVGNPDCTVMFVGEAPGEEEDLSGEPFVGRAGRLLDRMLEAIGLSRRRNTYIANILKSRPPANKIADALDCIPVCLPFLQQQIAIISPGIICALGSTAAQTLLDTKDPISRLRGTFHDYNGIKLIPTFHPSYLLRNPIAKADAWEDLKRLKHMIDNIEQARG